MPAWYISLAGSWQIQKLFPGSGQWGTTGTFQLEHFYKKNVGIKKGECDCGVLTPGVSWWTGVSRLYSQEQRWFWPLGTAVRFGGVICPMDV